MLFIALFLQFFWWSCGSSIDGNRYDILARNLASSRKMYDDGRRRVTIVHSLLLCLRAILTVSATAEVTAASAATEAEAMVAHSHGKPIGVLVHSYLRTWNVAAYYNYLCALRLLCTLTAKHCVFVFIGTLVLWLTIVYKRNCASNCKNCVRSLFFHLKIDSHKCQSNAAMQSSKQQQQQQW